MTTSGQSVPAARIDHLITTEAGDEVLVYDQAAHHIHHLNMTSVAVWRLCDGQRTVSEIALAAGLSDDLTCHALAKLANAGLLASELPSSMRDGSQTRRRFLKKAAIAGGIAVPAVVSMTAPQAAAAASCDGFICSPQEAEQGVTCGVGPLCDYLRCQFIPGTGLPACLPG